MIVGLLAVASVFIGIPCFVAIVGLLLLWLGSKVLGMLLGS